MRFADPNTAVRKCERRLQTVTRRSVPSAQKAPELRRALIGDLGHEHIHPIVVVVSNNPYGLDRPVAPGMRPTLDGGRLGVIVLDAPRRERPPRGQAWSTPRLEVDAPRELHAGIDGEAVDLTPPLELEIRPAALRVTIPPHHQGVSPLGHVPPPGPAFA